MQFVRLTRKGGQSVLVNVMNVTSVRDRAGDNLPMVSFTDGADFEVQESFEAVEALLMEPEAG